MLESADEPSEDVCFAPEDGFCLMARPLTPDNTGVAGWLSEMAPVLTKQIIAHNLQGELACGWEF